MVMVMVMVMVLWCDGDGDGDDDRDYDGDGDGNDDNNDPNNERLWWLLNTCSQYFLVLPTEDNYIYSDTHKPSSDSFVHSTVALKRL